MKKINTSLIVACVALFFSTTVLAEVAIIVHPNSGAGRLDAKTAKKLFLGKTKSISGISSVTLVVQTDESPATAEFTKKFIKKAPSKYKALWSRLIFSGKAAPPKTLSNDSEVVAYVASHPNAVGYVSAAALDRSVRVLLRIR